MEKITLNEIVLNDNSLETLKKLQGNENFNIKQNIKLLKEIKDALSRYITITKDETDKLKEISITYLKVNDLVEIFENLKK